MKQKNRYSRNYSLQNRGMSSRLKRIDASCLVWNHSEIRSVKVLYVSVSVSVLFLAAASIIRASRSTCWQRPETDSHPHTARVGLLSRRLDVEASGSCWWTSVETNRVTFRSILVLFWNDRSSKGSNCVLMRRNYWSSTTRRTLITPN